MLFWQEETWTGFLQANTDSQYVKLKTAFHSVKNLRITLKKNLIKDRKTIKQTSG